MQTVLILTVLAETCMLKQLRYSVSYVLPFTSHLPLSSYTYPFQGIWGRALVDGVWMLAHSGAF